jgi:radical SAM superfamily enzyme YgiQ (UPF0313 family)
MVLPALGLERLGAAVEDIAQVELFDARFEPRMIEEVKRFNPDIVALNVKTTMYANQSYRAGREIRKALPNVKIVTGGLHAGAVPEESLDFADCSVRGEGEVPFRQIVQGLRPEEIAGLVYRDGSQIKSNPMAEPPMLLDGLKPPARHLRKPHYNYASCGVVPMDLLETSRGCTHACSFCSGGSVYPHKYRVHSPEYVFEEIRRISERGVKWCFLTDDHVGDFERVDKICDLILKSGIKMAFFCFIRPFQGELELKKKMVRAGFVMVSYGAESVNKAQRKRYGKGHPADENFLKRVNSEWFEAGACYVGNSYVFGDTNDSAADIAQFGRFARELDPGYIEPLYSQPYPGTPYREELKEKGLLNEHGSQWDYFTEGRLLVNHPELDEEALKALRVKMWLDFFSPRKAIRQLWFFLHLYENLDVTREQISELLARSTYTIFGCYLEDKYYADRYSDMIDTYFRESIHQFEPDEMDMSGRVDGVTDMLGMKGLKSAFANFDLRIQIKEGGKCLATFVFEIRKKKAIAARAYAGAAPNGYPSMTVSVPLSALKEALISPPTGLKKAISSGQLLLGNLPRLAFDSLKLAGRRLVA